MATSSTTTVIVGNLPLERGEVIFIIAVIIFILSIPMWQRLLTVTNKSYDV